MKEVRPLIGIPAVPTYDDEQDAIMALYQDYKDVVYQNGGIPFMILPNQDVEYETLRPKDTPRLTCDEKEDLKRLVDMCDGLLIPGGYKWYEFDEFIYNYALEKNIPILGIWGGMQMMCRIDKDKNDICEDNTVRNNTLINHHQREKQYVHYVNIIEGTLLSKIIGENKIKVNSKHNYHVENIVDLKISAYSEDGLIEAIEYENKKFVIGVQWHPETMLEYDENANKIFDEFMNKCRNSC